MKRLLFIALILMSSLTAGAQCFSCRFKLSDKESGLVLAEGLAYVQGACYRFETEEGLLLCDGKTRWLYSDESDELVIENNVTPVISDEELLSVQESRTYETFYGRYRINLTEIKKENRDWEASFFIAGGNLIGNDTIVTDLR